MGYQILGDGHGWLPALQYNSMCSTGWWQLQSSLLFECSYWLSHNVQRKQAMLWCRWSFASGWKLLITVGIPIVDYCLQRLFLRNKLGNLGPGRLLPAVQWCLLRTTKADFTHTFFNFLPFFSSFENIACLYIGRRRKQECSTGGETAD